MDDSKEDALSPQGLNFQSPNRNAPSPVFGSPGIPYTRPVSAAGSPNNASTFSANLKALIGEDEYVGRPSTDELADELARMRGEFQAQLDALSLKVGNWRSKDQRDRYRDRELLLDAIRKSAVRLNNSISHVHKLTRAQQAMTPQRDVESAKKRTRDEQDGYFKAKLEANGIMLNAIERIDSQGTTIEDIKTSLANMEETQNTNNSAVEQLKQSTSDTLHVLQEQIQAIASKAVSVEAFTALERRLRQSEEREHIFRSEIKRLSALVEDMSKNEQIHGENAKLTSELLHKHNKMEQKHNQLMTIHATLRKESSRDQLSGERSTKQLAQTVKILEEELRSIKRQLTQAVSLFRKTQVGNSTQIPLAGPRTVGVDDAKF